MLPLPFPLSVAGWETGMVRGDAVLCGKSNSWYRESVVRTIHFCLAEITTELTLLDVEATDKEIPQGQTIADIAGWKGEDAKGWRTVAEAFSANIFIWGFLFFSLAGALQIENSEETDQGKYECVATNSQGVRYSSPANLYVRGRTWNAEHTCTYTHEQDTDTEKSLWRRCLRYY